MKKNHYIHIFLLLMMNSSINSMNQGNAFTTNELPIIQKPIDLFCDEKIDFSEFSEDIDQKSKNRIYRLKINQNYLYDAESCSENSQSKDESILATHVRCNTCYQKKTVKTIIELPAIKYHLKSVHMNNNFCTLCNKSYLDIDIDNHAQGHINELKANDNSPYLAWATEQQINQSISRRPLQTIKEINFNSSEIISTQKKIYCSNCAIFNSSQRLIAHNQIAEHIYYEHIKYHITKNKYHCDFCPNRFHDPEKHVNFHIKEFNNGFFSYFKWFTGKLKERKMRSDVQYPNNDHDEHHFLTYVNDTSVDIFNFNMPDEWKNTLLMSLISLEQSTGSTQNAILITSEITQGVNNEFWHNYQL